MSLESEQRPSTAESPPFSLRGPRWFYASLMARYRGKLFALLVLTVLYNQVSVLRAGLIAVVIDSLGRENSPPAAAGERDEEAGRFLTAFENVWATLMPAAWEPPTRNLHTSEGLQAFFIFLATFLSATGAVLALFFFFKEFVAQRMVVSMLLDTRRALFTHLTYQSVTYFNDRRSGDLLSRVTHDVSLVQASLRGIFETVLQQPWTILSYLLVALYSQPFLFIAIFPVYLLLIYPVVRSSRKVLRHSRKGLQSLGVITEALQQLFTGIRIIKAFGMERHEIAAFDDKSRQYERSYLKMRRARIKGRSLQELAFNTVTAGLLLAGCWLLLSDFISAGDFSAFCLSFLAMYEPVKKISKAWDSIQESRPAIERVLEVLKTEPVITDDPDAVEFPGSFRTIELDGVSFSYKAAPEGDGGAPRPVAVRDISFEVSAGEVVALVGPSGSGKSTLADLIARFHDVDSGSIRIDGTDIRRFRHASYLQSVAIVSQDAFLFNTTIRENIGYGKEGAPLEEIVEAARIANAHEFIEAQPEGYETVIGDRGARLSGGQRQRLTIARAVLKNAPILILDEATSALDSESEREVQKGLDNLMRRRTTFVIAHRLSTIQHADKIVVLERGRVVEIGTHEELVARSGAYYRLYRTQSLEGAASGPLSPRAVLQETGDE